jgi:hypothetical protein
MLKRASLSEFTIITEQGVHVSGPMMKSKSEELAKKLGHNDFKATDSWLSQASDCIECTSESVCLLYQIKNI